MARSGYYVVAIFQIATFPTRKSLKKLRKKTIKIFNEFLKRGLMIDNFLEDKNFELNLLFQFLNKINIPIPMDSNNVKEQQKKFNEIVLNEMMNCNIPKFLVISNRYSYSKKPSYLEKIEKNIGMVKSELDSIISKYHIYCDYEIKVIKSEFLGSFPPVLGLPVIFLEKTPYFFNIVLDCEIGEVVLVEVKSYQRDEG